MTYACAHFVYGIEIPKGTGGDRTLQRMVDKGLVETTYNGMGGIPFWVGVQMGFIEATRSSLANCRIQPTESDKAGFAEKRDALLARLSLASDSGSRQLAALVRDAVPCTFLAWGSS